MAKIPLPPALLTLPIAHRAYHDVRAGRPENSRAAIRAAIAAGYAIEIDLQLSRDGVPMVFHDEQLKRLTGHDGWVSDKTAAELAQIPLLGGDECIPTLAEVLALVAGQTPLLIELKDQSLRMAPGSGKLEQAAAAILAGYAGPVAVMSFNPHMIARMAELAPDLPRGLTTSAFDYAEWAPLTPEICDTLRPIADYDRVGASFISHESVDLHAPRVAELRAQGANILCWTIKSAKAEAKAREIAENITFERYAAVHPA